MVKDYKITTTVNKAKYLNLRGKLISEGNSFSNWLDKMIDLGILKIEDKTIKITEKVETKEPSPPIQKDPVSFFKNRNELNSNDYI